MAAGYKRREARKHLQKQSEQQKEKKTQQPEINVQTNQVTDQKPSPIAEQSQGLGSETGLIGATKPARMLARAVNWQQANRFKLEKTKQEIEDSCKVDGRTIYDEILLNAVELMNDTNKRAKAIGVRAGATLARLVQADDHAKLRAELRPTVIAPTTVTIDQSNHTDNRRVMLMVPSNGRDPQKPQIAE